MDGIQHTMAVQPGYGYRDGMTANDAHWAGDLARGLTQSIADVRVDVERNGAANSLATEKIGAANILENAKNAAAAALAAAANAAAIQAAIAACCCELKESVRAQGDAGRELQRSIQADLNAIALAAARAELADLRGRGRNAS